MKHQPLGIVLSNQHYDNLNNEIGTLRDKNEALQKKIDNMLNRYLTVCNTIILYLELTNQLPEAMAAMNIRLGDINQEISIETIPGSRNRVFRIKNKS